MRFEQQLIPIQTPDAGTRAPRVGELSTSALLGSHDLKRQAELHWRLGLPVMTLVLTVLGPLLPPDIKSVIDLLPDD